MPAVAFEGFLKRHADVRVQNVLSFIERTNSFRATFGMPRALVPLFVRARRGSLKTLLAARGVAVKLLDHDIPEGRHEVTLEFRAGSASHAAALKALRGAAAARSRF